MKRLSKKDLELHKGKGVPLNQESVSGKDAATQIPFCGVTVGKNCQTDQVNCYTRQDNCYTGQEKCHTELYTNCNCEGESKAETCNCYYTLFDDCPNTYRTCAESASHAELCCPFTQEGDQCVAWSRDTNCITPVTQNCLRTEPCDGTKNCPETYVCPISSEGSCLNSCNCE